MPSAKSPISVLAQALGQTPALLGFAKVYAGKNSLALNRSPPSIVLFPVEAGYDSPHDNVASLVDVDMKLAAHLWASDLDQCWELRQRYVQALKQQAIGNPAAPINATPEQAGVYYEFLTETWDIEPDTAQQGQEMEVVIAARFAAAPIIQLGTGEIDSAKLEPDPTLDLQHERPFNEMPPTEFAGVVYWGVAAQGPLTAGDVQGLANHGAQPNRVRAGMAVNPGAGQVVVYAYPKAFGTGALLYDEATGAEVGTAALADVVISLPDGTPITYCVITSEQAGLGPFVADAK